LTATAAASDAPRGWRRLLRPTLVRRLMLAQVAMLTLLWSIAVGLVLGTSLTEDMGMVDTSHRSVLSVAHNLADRPAALAESLQRMDIALRETMGSDNDPSLSPSLLVWQHGRLVYHSEGVPTDIANSRLGVPEDVTAQGKQWRTRSLESEDGATRVALVLPAGPQMWLTFHSRGYYILPLVISVPFLLLPAWLSIRLALRPWRKVAREIASRDVRELAPLATQTRHDELRPLVDNFNALMQRLRASMEREQSFIADAAHELRTPIAALRVNVEALQGLQAQPGTVPPARQHELMARMVSASARAERLVNQLLHLMRSAAQVSAPRPALLRLDDLVQERLATLSVLARTRGVEVELLSDDPAPVAGDRDSLVSMIDNLIDNATKYAPPGSTVTVGIRRDGAQAELSVADHGPGIPPELRERVFDRFFRDPDQTQTGSGLGLAIVRSATEAHGGSIVLGETRPGPGLLVTVRLPLAREGIEPGATASVKTRAALTAD
jgi:two-component system, OmpR family, sensor histidine kinase QseC